MTAHIIKTEAELEKYISENGDFDATLTYLSQHNDTKECFVITGCTYASEAFEFMGDGYSLVITDDDYEAEVNAQLNAKHPELEGFFLRA